MTPKEAHQALKIVRDFFESNSSVSEEVALGIWDLLTALRGPDNKSPDLKETTTNIIRSETGFLKFLEKSTTFVSPRISEINHQIIYTTYSGDPDYHFLSHIKNAYEVIRRAKEFERLESLRIPPPPEETS